MRLLGIFPRFDCRILRRSTRPLSSKSQIQAAGQAVFPCLDVLQDRTKSIQRLQSAVDEAFPEPAYTTLHSGSKQFSYDKQFPFVLGSGLPSFDIAYETWGTLSPERDNAILIHTGLSASSHAKSHSENTSKGWWEGFVGPGENYPIDTDRFFVVCSNVLGGCFGSTGPSTLDPVVGKRYGTNFPPITVWDIVKAQIKLLDHLKINKLAVSIGASFGGMQALALPLLIEPARRPSRILTISSALRPNARAVSWRHIQRLNILTDPNFKKGHYYDGVPPHVGMKIARMVGTLTYRGANEWDQRWGLARPDQSSCRDITAWFCPDFDVEKYLDHQGEKFCLNYDANSLLYLSKAMDVFDLLHPPLPILAKLPTSQSDLTHLSLFQHIPTLTIGTKTDILFPIQQQEEIFTSLKTIGGQHEFVAVDSERGHDAFLVDEHIGNVISNWLRDS